MKYISLVSCMSVLLVCSAGANAQNFTYEFEFEEPVQIGGLGPDNVFGVAHILKGVNKYKNDEGNTIKAKLDCVSMRQPSSSLFTYHVSCDSVTPEAKVSGVYGCNVFDAEKEKFNCVGSLEVKTGESKGTRGNVTLFVEGAKATGTGQWFQ